MNSAKLIDLLLFGGVLWNLQLRFQFFEEEDKVVQLNKINSETGCDWLAE